MDRPLPALFRAGDHDALARLIRDRWGVEPSPASLHWLCEVATGRTGMAAGGDPRDPWTETTWLAWIKNRLDDFAANSGCAGDPSRRSGAEFAVEADPADRDAWRAFLERFSAELLAVDDLELWVPIAEDARAAGWLGFPPAAEATIRAAEGRLGRRLPPSLRAFYAVTDGWGPTGYNIYDVLPVGSLGWLADREPQLHELALEVEAHPGPFRDDPGDEPLRLYRSEGTRARRSLILNAEGNNGDCWVLDPGAEPHDGEWPAGCLSEHGWEWDAPHFAALMVHELRTLRTIRS